MAVAFDAVGPAGGAGHNTSTTPSTWTHVCGAGATDLVVHVTSFSGSSNLVTGVTYAGTSMTLLGYSNSGGAGSGGVASYYLASPTTGSNTVSVSFSGAADCIGGSISFTGGGSHGTVFTAASSGLQTSVSVSVTGTTTGGMIHAGCCYGNGSAINPTNSVTSRWTLVVTGNSASDGAEAGTVPSTGGGANQTVGFTSALSAADDWGLVAVEILPPGGGGTTTAQTRPLPRRNYRPAGRGRLGKFGACAAGILAVTTLSPQPSKVPPARPQPVINRPPPPHRAIGKGILAKTTLSPQPSSVPPPLWRQPIQHLPAHRAVWRRVAAPPPVVAVTSVPPARPQLPILHPAPHRVIWRGVAGPAPAVVAVTAVAPARPQPTVNRPPAPHRAITRRVSGIAAPLAAPARPRPVTNRPPAPHRAVVRWLLAVTTLSPQPTRVPPPQWRQPFAPRPAHRGIWRAVAGPAPPAAPFSIGVLTARDVATATFTPVIASAVLTATGSSATLTATDQKAGGPS